MRRSDVSGGTVEEPTMGGTDPGSAREEAERLVATLLAGARLASAGSAGGAFGSWAGCCPVSSVTARARTRRSGPVGLSPPVRPNAASARSVGASPRCGTRVRNSPSGSRPAPVTSPRASPACSARSPRRNRPPSPAEPPPSDRPDRAGTRRAPTVPRATGRPARGRDDHVWRDATRTGHDSQPAPERDVWSVATRTADPLAPAAVPPVDEAGTATVPAPTTRPVVPASRVPDDADAEASGDGA